MAEEGQLDLREIPEGLRSYFDVPAVALGPSRREELGMRLNPPRQDISEEGLLKDWRGLAERLGFTPLELDNLAIERNPTVSVLGRWMSKPSSKLGFLLQAFCAMERIDILRDHALMRHIEQDVQNYLRREAERANADSNTTIDPFQDPEVRSSDDMEVMEYTNITINETPGNPEYFDAFVSYASADFEFVNHMINKLEGQHGLKLCVPNRDLVGGCAAYTIMAKLIKDRCTKMIIVLSPDFKNSIEGDFQTKFALSLTPGAQEKKLIPVVYKSCQIPDILNHICLLDYTRCDVVDWFWSRLANSLKKVTYRTAISGPQRRGGRVQRGGRPTPAHTAPIETTYLARRSTPNRQPHTAPIRITGGGQLVEMEESNDSLQMEMDHFGQRPT